MQEAEKAARPLKLEKKPNQQPQAKKLILMDKEQKKYTEFLKIKKQCWKQYESAIKTIEKANNNGKLSSIHLIHS